MTRGVLIDLGGVLARGVWPEAARAWAGRFGTTPGELLAAIFGGSDTTVLVGAVDEDTWWRRVAARLDAPAALVDALRADAAARETWNEPLLDRIAAVHGPLRTAVVSNAWPGVRARADARGLAGFMDAIVLSCEFGAAKPDAAIYRHALDRLGVEPSAALFVDDTEANVAAARGLGMTAHLHRDTASTAAAIVAFAGSGRLVP
ncbi:MAG TPA: HAD family phosphatase [Streptosporangiaceae bacterium]|jgi:putative hydrolase of the HAD superfamily